MAYDIASITKGIVDRPPRILLHGVEKIGKSTFASQFPNAIILPIKGEEGIDALDVASFPVINSYTDCCEANYHSSSAQRYCEVPEKRD